MANSKAPRLLALPKQEEQPAEAQPQQFPIKNIQITPQGVLVQDVLSQNISINTLIPAEAMDRITHDWREFRKQQASELQTIAAVRRSRND